MTIPPEIRSIGGVIAVGLGVLLSGWSPGGTVPALVDVLPPPCVTTVPMPAGPILDSPR